MKIQHSNSRLDSLLRRRTKCQLPLTLRLAEPSLSPYKRRKIDRLASTSSTTAINARQAIPDVNRPLHDALLQIKSKALAHVSSSRLQLAIQGLETDKPAARVGILGLDAQDTARRIARLLLVDALENEHTWEKQILEHAGDAGILLRYGQPQNTNIPQRSTIPVLAIPSPLLERLNIDLLITSINGEQAATTDVPAEAFLAPAVGVPTAIDGRQVTVDQPVHRTLLVVQGFDELVAGIQLLSDTSFRSQEDKASVTLVANLPDSNSQPKSLVLVSDVARAEKGLAAIRKSTSLATTYEHEWLGSGMPQISNWLAQNAEAGDLNQRPAVFVQRLVSSLLASATSSLDQTAAIVEQKTRSTIIDPAIWRRIEDAIEDFSRAAHQELQSGLASAWSSRNWRKLSWYKLFWRVDDVGLIISDLTTNAWLPKTERATYELSGRLTQIGIRPVMAEPEVPETEHTTAFDADTTQSTILDPAPALLATAATAPANDIILPERVEPVIQAHQGTEKPVIRMRPLPVQVPITSVISSTRANYLNQQITDLTSTAQQLVFRTLSISGMSAGLSALTYISQIAPTLYEAGTIFAVGTVFALYRMQSGWQIATKTLENGLFQEGRDVIRRVVTRMQELVEGKAAEIAGGDSVEKQMLDEARQAVDNAKLALNVLQQGK